jgi:hypothetical protein
MSDDAPIIRTCDSIYLLSSSMECYSCRKPSPIYALMLLPPFASSDADDDWDEDECMVRHIETMPSTIVEALGSRTSGKWRRTDSITLQETYWMNHCEHCDAKQGDFYVHGPDGAFWPNDEAEMDKIQAERFAGPHDFVDGDMSYSGAMIDWRDRLHGVTPAVNKLVKPRKRK